MTILMHLPKNEQASSALLRESRSILVQQFDNLHPYDQEYLMRVYWEQLRDPSLVPSLKKMLAVTGMASKNIHDAALKRLIEVSSDEARPYVVAELKDPASLVESRSTRQHLGQDPARSRRGTCGTDSPVRTNPGRF